MVFWQRVPALRKRALGCVGNARHAGDLGNGTADGLVNRRGFSFCGEAVGEFVKARLSGRLRVVLAVRAFALGDLVEELEASLECLFVLRVERHAVAHDCDAQFEGRARGERRLLLFVHFIYAWIEFQNV